jgi:hypothetical protein
VQAYDGLVRIAPSWPSDWTERAPWPSPTTPGCRSSASTGCRPRWGSTPAPPQQLAVRSPWPGQSVTVVDGRTRPPWSPRPNGGDRDHPAQAGGSYLVRAHLRATNASRSARSPGVRPPRPGNAVRRGSAWPARAATAPGQACAPGDAKQPDRQRRSGRRRARR